MKIELIKKLIGFGLSENESKVYLASLSLGQSTILKIANLSCVKRTTVYSCIDSLSQMGLIKIENIGFKKKYSALNPDKLEEIAEQRKQNLLSIIPDLDKLSKGQNNNSDRVLFFKNINAIKNAYGDLLQSLSDGDYYYVISDTEKLLAQDENFFSKYFDSRKKYELNLKFLFKKNTKSTSVLNSNKFISKYTKLFSDNFNINCTVTITPKTLLIHQTHPTTQAIIIQNKNIIDLQKHLFELIWNMTK